MIGAFAQNCMAWVSGQTLRQNGIALAVPPNGINSCCSSRRTALVWAAEKKDWVSFCLPEVAHVRTAVSKFVRSRVGCCNSCNLISAIFFSRARLIPANLRSRLDSCRSSHALCSDHPEINQLVPRRAALSQIGCRSVKHKWTPNPKPSRKGKNFDAARV